MFKVACHIEYLLQRTDCVVVPGFGAFILQHSEARFDSNARKFIPPSATVAFNPEINHNDGLLVSSVARASSIPYETAAREVFDEVETMKAQLNADRHIDLGRLGSFNIEGENKIFTPCRHNHILHVHDGLSALEVSTVEMRADAELPVSDRRHKRAAILRLDHAIRVAASIVIIVLIGLICSTPASIDDRNMTLASVYPSTPATEYIEEPGAIISEPDITLFIAEVNETQEVNESKGDNKPAEFRSEESDPYILVVGSFDSISQAKRFISSKPDKFKLSIIESDGRYRVYAATGQSAAQATVLLQNEEFASIFSSAWPCHK